MLDQLVESKNNKTETAKRAKFLGTTFVLVVSLAFSGVLWSLFAKNISMSGDQFEISTMVAPVPIPENKPQPPEQNQPKNAPKIQSEVITRQTNTLRLDESPKVPKEISTVPNTQKARPNAPFVISKQIETDGVVSSVKASDRNGAGNETGIETPNNSDQSKVLPQNVPPPPLVKKPVEPAPRKNVVKSGGVMNGQAKNLPKPVYSAAAKAVNASGEVQVQITVDESGKVISANAVSGHPLLRGEAEKAARGATFSPTLLSNQPVKVTGIIVYRFTK
ncbi:MAG: TonB family protein [Pyrinomonadaceae bacterium]|nr:TonB family protein [Pyrinomonadaceae bacterium]